MSGGQAKTEYSLDGAVTGPRLARFPCRRPPTTPATSSPRSSSRSADADGDLEEAKALKVGIDTRRPATKAPYAAAARQS